MVIGRNNKRQLEWERHTMARPLSCSFGVVILAAGASSRMGLPKLLLPWGKGTIIEYLIHQWGELQVAQIAIVCAAGDKAFQAELDRLGFPSIDRIVNETPEKGMFGSIQCAAKWRGWKPELTDVVISLGDQPHLQLGTLRALLDFKATLPGRICQPAFNGYPKHPVILPYAEFKLLGQTGFETLRDFLRSRADIISVLPLNDPGLDLDIDRPEDYERAARLWAEAQKRQS